MFLKYQQPMARKFRAEQAEGGDGESVKAEKEKNGDIEAIHAQLEQLSQENARLSAKINEANKHKREAEKAAEDAARKRQEDEGDYQQLYKSLQDERKRDLEERHSLEQQLTAVRVSEVASKIALRLNPIEAAADDLNRKIASRLKFTEDGVKVLDKSGELTVSTLDQLTEELRGSADVSYMLKGIQSSGGGASSGSGSGGAAQTITRSEFEQLDPAKRMEVSKASSAGKIEITD